MDNISEVLSNKKVFYISLIVAHNEQEEYHRGRKTMTNDGHIKYSTVSHIKSSDEQFEREIDKFKAHISVLI
jgi:hypothetical protein